MEKQLGRNPLLADPTIFYWEGTYYLYGTDDGHLLDKKINGEQVEGFPVYTSVDLVHWEGPSGATNGYALVKGDAYGTKGFWAPQVFHYNGKFYMAYTADEQIAIASSFSPLGPFTQDELKPVSTVTRQIDPFVLFDDDGKVYLYHVRLTEGNRLFVAELSEDLKIMDENTLTECIEAEAGTWEDTESTGWTVAEGPAVLKEGELYYFFYSANDFRNVNYAVGYATADSPYGPWKRYEENPVIDRGKVGYNGTGHGDITFTAEGEMYYVLHTHWSETAVSPRKTALVQLDRIDGYLEPKLGTFRYIEVNCDL